MYSPLLGGSGCMASVLLSFIGQRQPVAGGYESQVQESEHHSRHQKGPQHFWRERWCTGFEHDGLRVQGAEQVDAQVNEGHQQHAENADYRTEASALTWVVHRCAKGQIAYEQKE